MRNSTFNLVVLLGIIVMIFACNSKVHSQNAISVVGDWNGSLEVQGMTIPVIFHITETSGELIATMDSPSQGAMGIPVDETIFEDGKLLLDLSSMGIVYTALYDGEDNISGKFQQNGMELPLVLTKVNPKAQAKRVEKVRAVANSNTEEVLGKWNGELDISGMSLRIIFNISDDNGTLLTTMDSPDQGANGIPTDNSSFTNNELSIVASQLGMEYVATYNKTKNQLDGTFRQNGMTLPLVMSRDEIEKKVIVRPQEPKDFPYHQEDIKIINTEGGHLLAGTLTKPSNDEFDKVVVLVSGSGPQNRNEELLGHKPFLVLSDHLTRNGIAVLRYDDRGVGESTGEFSKATSQDFANDAESAVNYLKSREDMKGKVIGIAGHSEGGMIAPMVAASSEAVHFIILLAGPGIDIKTLMLIQSDKIASADDSASREDVDANLTLLQQVFDVISSDPTQDKETLSERLKGICMNEYEQFSETMKADIGDDPEAYFDNQIKTMTSDWFLYFISFNPADYLSQVNCPVLAINGELDVQVTAKENLLGIETALKKANNKNVTVREFEDLNHLFQKAETGSTNEYAKLDETFNIEVMTFVSDWINALN